MNSINPFATPAPGAVPVLDAVQNASARTGVDFDYLVDVARVESRFDPSAKAATSSARGLYQFTKQTWLATLRRHGASHGLGWAASAIGQDAAGRFGIADPMLRDRVLALRNDPVAASNMAAALTSDNQDYIEGRLGRAAEPVDLYLAHFLGPAGAVRFLSAWSENPGQAGAALLPDAAAANRSIFYAADGGMRSLDEIRDLFRAKLDEGGGPGAMPGGGASPPGWRMQVASASSAGGGANSGGRPPLPMMDIQPMPRKLSMDFAASAYRRLASLSGGAV